MRRKESGTTLSEALISLFLTSLIIMMLIQCYLSSKQYYLKAEQILNADFDLQWVGDLLSDSIRRAGFTPCLSIDQLNLRDSRKNGTVIHGLKIENNPYSFIQINRMDEEFAKVISIKSPVELVVSNSHALNEKHPVLIADCEHAELHQIITKQSFAHQNLIRLDKPLQFHYSSSTYIGEFLEEKWFIKRNSHGETALYYQLRQTEEITPLVHSLQTYNQVVHGKQFVKIVLGLAAGKNHELMVLVRGS